MIVKKYQDMLSKKSAIRQLFDYGAQRAKIIGYENVFDYSLGNPSVAVPKEFNEALARLAMSGNDVAVHGYSPSLGNTMVREKLADYLKSCFGIPYTKENIFMTTGAAGAIAHAVRAVVNPESEVITFAPYFPEYNPYITGPGATLKIIEPDVTSFQINFEKFENAISEKTEAVLINSPNNPSGIMYSEETLKKLASILEKKQSEYGHPIYLISDEPYREIVFKGRKCPYTACYYDNTITCYSYSKALSLPGERIGYVATSPKCEGANEIIDICGQISRFTGHNCPPSIIQLAIAETLGVYSDMSVYEKNEQILYKALTEMGFKCVEPDGTFYMFPEVPEGTADELSEKAKQFDLLLVPGTSFGCPKNFRISYCIDTEKVERSLDAFEKLAKLYF